MYYAMYVGANADQLFTWVAESSPAYSFITKAVHFKQGLRVEKKIDRFRPWFVKSQHAGHNWTGIQMRSFPWKIFSISVWVV